MPRPCLDKHNLSPSTCPVCRLSQNDPRYKVLWGDEPAVSKTVSRGQSECMHLGAANGSLVSCQSCGGNVQLKTFHCGVYGECTLGKAVKGVACCKGCKDYTPEKVAKEEVEVKKAITVMPARNVALSWAYGITTVPGRFDTLLPKTLASLEQAGFPRPRLFIDGCTESELPNYLRPYEKTLRTPRIRAYGNWILALGELFIRSPRADRYAIFQDDFVTYRNLKYYLDNSPYPEQGYLNLYTFPSNQKLAPKDGSTGWYESNQLGYGAVALVFSKEAAFKVLNHEHTINKAHSAGRNYSWKGIDGGVVDAMKKSGWKEYVHNPSLVQHTGLTTSMEGPHPRHLQAVSFRGEDYDAREMIS